MFWKCYDESSQMLWLCIMVLERMTRAKWEKNVYKFWTWWMNNFNKKYIIFSEHFLKQRKLSEKKPKSSVSDAAAADSGLSVPGKACLHMLLLVVHIKLSSKIISVIIASCALSFPWRVDMCFFLTNQKLYEPWKSVWKTLEVLFYSPGLYLLECIELLFARLLLRIARAAVQRNTVFLYRSCLIWAYICVYICISQGKGTSVIQYNPP